MKNLCHLRRLAALAAILEISAVAACDIIITTHIGNGAHGNDIILGVARINVY